MPRTGCAEQLWCKPFIGYKCMIIKMLDKIRNSVMQPSLYGTLHAGCVGVRNVPLERKRSKKVFQENKSEEEPKGFLPYRIVDRRGDHFDHRGDCHPEPAPFAYGGQ